LEAWEGIMGEQDLSRRQILTGVVAAGGAGALGGRGTTALLSDRETFTNNSIQGSASTAGVINMDVSVGLPDDREGVRYQITLPDSGSSPGTNNPAYIWLRTVQCPEPVQLANRVKVEVTVSYDGGETSTSLQEGSIRDVLDKYRTGIHLGQFADDPCLQLGDEWLVDIEATNVESSSDSDFANSSDVFANDESFGNQNTFANSNTPEESSGSGNDGQLFFQLEFYGQQCRYQTGSNYPWDDSDVIDSCKNNGDAKAISFIAFCGESGMNPSISNTDPGVEPTSANWETDADVRYVSVKSGNNWTIYDYRNQTKTDGTVETGDDPDAEFFGYISPKGGTASEPCDVAARRISENSEFNGEWSKFEYDEDNDKFEKE
jgi:predicted ribosomally synthesized peptide with SipW-like signal peptide